MAETLEGAERTVARIAQNRAVALGDQHRKAVAHAPVEPLAAVFQIDLGFVPYGEGVGHRVVIDSEQDGKVGLVGGADCQHGDQISL